MPLRVAYIVDSFGMGGLERCVTRLVNGLDARQFEPLVICLQKNGAAAQWIQRPGVPIRELQRGSGTDWQAIGRLATVLRNERVDIVHSHNWATLLETSIARRRAGVPIHVHAQRGMFFHASNNWLKSAIRRQATRWCIHRANSLVVVDESVQNYWQSHFGTTHTPIRVITNGISVPDHDATGQEATRLRQSLGIGADSLVVGSIGRFVPVKSFETLIEAVSLAHPHDSPVELVLVGNGETKAFLEAAAAQYGVAERVHFVGEQQNVGDWLKTMNLYVNCSRSEGMSQSVLEAMSLGIPMVVTDVGANRRLVSGNSPCGVVVPPGDAAALAGALGDVLHSASTKETFSRNAFDRHRTTYGIDRMLDDYTELYCELAANRMSRPSKLKSPAISAAR